MYKYLFVAVAEAMATGEGSNVGSNTTPAAPVSQEKEPEQVTKATDPPPTSETPAVPTENSLPTENPLPEHVPYVLIGAGTASFACMKAIMERDPGAKVGYII